MEITGRKCTLSIVIPVYRSAAILPRLVEEIHAEVGKQEGISGHEVILVNDASPDASWDVIRKLAAADDRVRGINLRRNAGQHNAVMAGLNHVRGEYVVTMDDDLQHPPAAIGALVGELRRGYDVCYTRYLERKHALWKKLGSRFNDWAATRLIGKPPGLYLSSFRGLRREIADELVKYDGPYAYVDGLIVEVTRSITSIDVLHQPRHEGESNYTLRRLLSLWLNMATSSSLFPLRIATYLGFLLAGVSSVMVIFVAAMKLTHPDYPAGWASLMAAVLLIGSIQTLCIGMIGEYLGRTYLQLSRKRQFIVAATTWERNAE